jgi:hypothetical protein
MGRCELMEGDFADMEVSSAVLIGLGVGETFNSIRFRERGVSIDGTINDTVTADTQYLHELQGVIVDEGTQWGVSD